MGERRAPGRTENAVRLAEARLVGALALGIEAVHDERPLGPVGTSGSSAPWRRRTWSRMISAKRAGPPPRCDDAGRNAAAARRRPRRRQPHARPRRVDSESLPGTPPSGPNSSPRTSTCDGDDPERAEVRERPARRVGLVGQPDLDVLGVAGHAGQHDADFDGGRGGDVDHLGERRQTARWRRASTAASSSPIRAFGGSIHSGSGMRSIFAGSVAATRSRRAAHARRALDGDAPRPDRGPASSSDVARRRWTSTGPSRVTWNTSEPRLRHRKRRPGPSGRAASCGSTLPTCVPVTTNA